MNYSLHQIREELRETRADEERLMGTEGFSIMATVTRTPPRSPPSTPHPRGSLMLNSLSSSAQLSRGKRNIYSQTNQTFTEDSPWKSIMSLQPFGKKKKTKIFSSGNERLAALKDRRRASEVLGFKSHQDEEPLVRVEINRVVSRFRDHHSCKALVRNPSAHKSGFHG